MKKEPVTFCMSDAQYKKLMWMLKNLPGMEVSFKNAYKKKRYKK